MAAAALLVRLVYFFEYAISPLMGFYGSDDQYYLAWAGRIAAGDWLGNQVFEQGPLYPYLLGAFFAALGPRTGVVLVLQLLSGVLVALLVYDGGRKLFDQTVGLTAGLLAAVYGPLVFYECMLMKSFLAPLLTMLALAAGLRFGVTRKLAWLIAAGIAVGLACLIQEYHALMLVPLGLWTWQTDRTGGLSKPVRLSHVGALVAAALVCILPCTLRNWAVAGERVLVTAGGGEVFYIAQGPQARGFYNPPDFVLAVPGQEHEDFRVEARRRTGRELTRSESSRYWFREGLQAMIDDPLRSLQLTFSKAAILLGDYDVPDSQSYVATRQFVPALWVLPSFGWIAGLGLVGMGLCLRDWRRHVLPLGFVAAHTLPILIFYNFGRFRIGMMPLCILFAAYAGVWTARGLRDAATRQKGVVLLLVAALLTAASFYPLLREDFRLSDAKFIAVLAMRGQNYDLAEQKLREISDVLERLPVEESQSVQYLAQVAEVRQRLAEVYLRTGRWLHAVEQIERLRTLPVRERAALLRQCEALILAALEDPRIRADRAGVARLNELLKAIGRESL